MNLHSQPASLKKPAPDTALKQTSSETLVDSLVTLSTINSSSLLQHGAHLAVMSELLASVLTHLPHTSQEDVVASFRDRIEKLMSHWDDRAVPEQYYSEFLTEVNRYLSVLRWSEHELH